MAVESLIIDDRCFACGKKNAAGIRLDISPVDPESGKTSRRALSTFTLRKFFQGYGGIIHGGILSTILDEIMIYALLYNDIPTMTAKIEVKYKAQAVPDEILRAEGWMTRDRRKMVEAEGKISNAAGQIVAEAKGLFVKAKQRLVRKNE